MYEKKSVKGSTKNLAIHVSVVSIIVNVVLSAAKLLAGIFGKSSAMVSDAIHSASDVFSTFVVIAGVKMSEKKRIKDTLTDMSVWSVLPL